MATLPKPDLAQQFLTVDELWEIRGTPEFQVEYSRQMAAVAKHDRRLVNSSRGDVDWTSIKGWE